VDTTWANVRFATRVRELLTGRQYQPSDPAIFAEMMQALPGGPEGLVFVDLGSGKGRALLLASNYPFRKIVGVELLPELHELAKENIQHYRFDRQRCHDFELYCCDARDYELPREPLLVFLFDPFPEAILGTVVRGIEQSLRQSPRRLIVAYMNPVGEHVLAEAQIFRRVAGTIQWAVYETKL
jgi:SAM-dependent methyltransferase